MAKQMQLEVGKTYVAEDRSLVRIVLKKELPARFAFLDSDESLWSADGVHPNGLRIVCEANDFAAIDELNA